ncbi:DUF4231 domain-containing protein [Prosthecochloris aestuarii]|nr:DUF4231 domain-containing protein [Prosthecochloris aestuarii]
MTERKKMTPEEYLENRLEDQITWYDKKSGVNKLGFIGFQIATLIASASIPVISLFSGAIWARLVVAILGSTTTVTAGIVALYQFREHWIQYRTTAESLKQEKYRFHTKTEPYSGENAFSILVDRVESLVFEENTTWHQRLLTKKEDTEEPENNQ